ncbi:hypothetical protein [Deinococcus sp.]|uniref:hypothetical protein n=1 Tax=Deinococcus sp. TaxID=47478 RepID=UPI003B5B9653
MPSDAELSDEEKRAILAEEAALARAEAAARQQAGHLRARETFRAQVRAAHRARRGRWGWWGFGLLWAVAAVLVLRGQQPAVPDDTSGGIASSALIDRCEREVTAQLGQLAAEFPNLSEAAGQITASADGKRWDGWVVSIDANSGGAGADAAGRLPFSCEYSPPTDSLQVQLIK